MNQDFLVFEVNDGRNSWRILWEGRCPDKISALRRYEPMKYLENFRNLNIRAYFNGEDITSLSKSVRKSTQGLTIALPSVFSRRFQKEFDFYSWD